MNATARKKLCRVWLAVDEETHRQVTEIADSMDRTIQGQYRRLIAIGLKRVTRRQARKVTMIGRAS